MRQRRLVLALVVAAALAACGRCGNRPPPVNAASRPVALVDGEPISAPALAREFDDALATRGADGGGLDRTARRRLLDDAIDRVLLVREARRRSLAPSNEDIDRALARIRSEYPGPQFQELLAQQRVDEAGLRARLAEQLTVEKVLADVASSTPQLSDADVERYYREHPLEFDEPAQVHAFQIVVATREEATRAREEVRRHPAKFADVARQRSIAPEAQQGGDLGWFGKGSGMPEVFDVCLSLPVDAISDVVASPYGFHVFKVVARRPPRHRPLVEVASTIRDQLLREQRSRAEQALLATLRQRATIVVDESALDAVNR